MKARSLYTCVQSVYTSVPPLASRSQVGVGMHSIMSKSSEVCDWSSRRACCDSHQGRRLNILSLKPFRTAPMISPHDTADSFCMVTAPSFTDADGRISKILQIQRMHPP